MEDFRKRLSDGMLNVFSQDYRQRTALFKLESFEATAEEFLSVLQLYQAVGGDLNQMDHQGNSLLMLASNDALCVALVWAGASTYYFRNRFRKRALGMGAANGCHRMMDAIMERDSPDQEYVEGSLHSAALQLSYDTGARDMSGIHILVVEHGACVNRWGTLARCADRNPFVVSALISLGADRTMLVWDSQRGLNNTALHRVAECQNVDVFEALVLNLPPEQLDVRDEHGSTPVMTLLREHIASEDYLRQRFDWLMGRGASCLPFDDNGRRVSETPWGKKQPFRTLIAARVREENWVKRRGVILLRMRGVEVGDGGEDDYLLLEVASLVEFGVFKHIVGYL